MLQNAERLKLALAAAIAGMLPAGVTAQLTREEWPEEPAAVVQYLLEQPYFWRCGNAAMSWQEYIQPLHDRISAEPHAFAEPLAIAARLPKSFAPIIRESNEFRAEGEAGWVRWHYPARPGLLPRAFRALELSEALGKETAEPILVQAFEEMLVLIRDGEQRLTAMRAENGWEQGPPLAVLRDPFDEWTVVYEGGRKLKSRINHTVGVMHKLGSPALAERVVDAWELGFYDLRKGWGEYLAMSLEQRPELLAKLEPRIRKRETPDDLRWLLARHVAEREGVDEREYLGALRRELARYAREGWPEAK